MIYYKVLLAFKGTRYFGWQRQKDFEPTVQGEFERSLKRIFKSEEIKTVGSGRTDTGVHSLGHVVKVSAPFEIPPASLVAALNSNLPGDIRVLKAEFCSQEFRPTNDAIKKEYRYLFTNHKQVNPFQAGLVANYPYELDFEKMREACKVFVGRKDFSNFCCAGSEPSSTVRTVFECELETNLKANFQGVFPDYHVIRVVGDGFLKQMVRLIVGCVWQVGRGKLETSRIEEGFNQKIDHRLGEVAPAEGLYKAKTWY